MTATARTLTIAFLVAAAVATSGCSAAPEPAPSPASAEPTPSAAAPVDMMDRVGNADWECGQFSALQGIMARSWWQHQNGQIDDAAYDSRLRALKDSWVHTVFGDSSVTPSLREAQRAAADGVGEDNAAFQRAATAVTLACDAAGSIVSYGALLEMGG